MFFNPIFSYFFNERHLNLKKVYFALTTGGITPLQSLPHVSSSLAHPLLWRVFFSPAFWSKGRIKQAILIDSALQSQNDSYIFLQVKIKSIWLHLASSPQCVPHWVKHAVNREGYFNRSLQRPLFNHTEHYYHFPLTSASESQSSVFLGRSFKWCIQLRKPNSMPLIVKQWRT